MTTWEIRSVKRAVSEKPIHCTRILCSTTRKNAEEIFGGSMNYLFINFYRGMGLLTAPEHEKFPLEREIADNEEVLGGNEVARRGVQH